MSDKKRSIRQVNYAIIEGNLTREPEFKVTPNGKQTVSFSIANNWGEKVSYINCIAWEKTAELMSRFATKGTHVIVQGRHDDDRYEKEGKTVYKVQIIVDNVRFISGLKEASSVPAAPAQQNAMRYTVQQQPDIFVTPDFQVVNGAGIVYPQLRVERSNNGIYDAQNQFYGTANIPAPPPAQQVAAPVPQMQAPVSQPAPQVAPQTAPMPQAQPSVGGIGGSTTGFTPPNPVSNTVPGDDDIPF